MDTYDLENAFFKRLGLLAFDGLTLWPDEVFDPKNTPGAFRRGTVMLGAETFAGFGNGRYCRVGGIYQIDLYVVRTSDNALRVSKRLSDAHLNHFYPPNGRGLTLTENATAANILKRPEQRSMGREGVYLVEQIDIDFYVEIPAAG